MRRSRVPTPPPSPYRALAHHHAQYQANGQPLPESVSSLIRSFNVETNPARPIRPSPLAASTIPDMPLDLVDRIRSFPLFMSAPDEFLAAIGRHLRPQIHAAHDVVLTEGDDALAMYWLVRGVVAVTSRDGEAVYAELKPGAFFGEIGVLMRMPRTATIVARTKCLLVVLKKEDLHAELPKFPDMEKAILQEAQERLSILKKKQLERGKTSVSATGSVARERIPGEVTMGDAGAIKEGTVVNSKKRKSPSPGVIEDPAVSGSALGSGLVNVRTTLKELSLFSELPSDILHFLGLSAQPVSFPPFTDIVRQGGPGSEIYFIVRGECEVIREEDCGGFKRATRSSAVRPRLKAGQYFGEVASLGLAAARTATVRTVTSVECLMIGGGALEELWKRCPPGIRSQVEETARNRYQKPDEDVEMKDADDKAASDASDLSTPKLPEVTFTVSSKTHSPVTDEAAQTRIHTDPDPYLSVDMENLRNRRRNSLAPPTPSPPDSPSSPGINGFKSSQTHESSPLKLYFMSTPTTPPENDDHQPQFKKQRTLPHRPASLQNMQTPVLPDDVLVMVFEHLDIVELLRARLICSHWRRLLTTSDKLCKEVDLSSFNRHVTDWALANVIGPFIGSRPGMVDISNCFHVTDEGFQAFYKLCGKNIKSWRMRSVWDVSASQILEMSENSKGLEEVDWSNCRKVGDNLLARVVGWVVPEPPPERKNVIIASSGAPSKPRNMKMQMQWQQAQAAQSNAPPPGTVIGCPKLRRLNLSYCKHITDRSMAHLAAHASSRLETLSLTRCTSISDAGFQSWAPFRFPHLTRLCLADCTYLSDNAIVALVNSAKQLTHLDLSFCCALSDTATEVVALGLPLLQELRLAFCGSAVSDASLGCIALHLNELRGLSVRGCVRVTGVGVENVLEGCGRLEWLDVSQCKNLGAWLAGGGVVRWGFDERGPGRWLPMSVTRGSSFSSAQRTVDPALLMNNHMNVPRPQTPINGSSTNGNSVTSPDNENGGLAPSPFGNPGGGGLGMAFGGAAAGGMGPMMKPVVPPRGMRNRRQRKPVRFIVEKGGNGLR